MQCIIYEKGRTSKNRFLPCTHICRYEVVTKEISTNSRWPPARFDAGGLSGLFHRLDSAYQSFSNSGGKGGDTDSLIDSGSETESISGNSCFFSEVENTPFLECESCQPKIEGYKNKYAFIMCLFM